MARDVVERLPSEHAESCVTTTVGALFRGTGDHPAVALRKDGVHFRAGSVRGVMPTVVSPSW